MTQYCRYCTACHVANGNWCEIKEKELTDAQIKHSNKCRDFEFCSMDVYDENRTYQPRAVKKVIRTINEVIADQLTFDSISDCTEEIISRL